MSVSYPLSPAPNTGYDGRMKRKEIFATLAPLLDHLYQFSHALLPDDLEAEQLVIDGINGFIIKEKKWLTRLLTDSESESKLRRIFFQKMISHIYGLATKRAAHFNSTQEQPFYELPLRNRAIMTLRYLMNYDAQQIEDFLGLARWEVIEGIHTGRYMLMNELTAEAP